MNDSSSSSEAGTPHSLITEDHVRAALTADKGNAASLIAWNIVDFIKKGKNFACIVTSVEIKYMLGGRNSEVVYVVKLYPCTKGESRSVFNDIAFEKEANLYLHLIPEFNSTLKRSGQREIHFPKCLHVSQDKGKQIIFLEDLRSQSYKMHDDRRGLDEAHTTLVLREIARLHAASLLLQNKTPDEDFMAQHPYIKKDWHYLTRTFRGLLDLFENSLMFSKEMLNKERGYERVIAWIDTIIPNLVNIIYEQLECGQHKVVCHGDCWNNNLLFKYSEDGHPEDVMLLDLQLVRYATPATDLTYFLFTSTTYDVRKPNTEAFLASYYSALSSIMKDAGQKVPFTQAQLLKDYRNKSLTGVIFGAIIIPLLAFEFGDAVTEKEKPEWIYSKKREELNVMLDSDTIVKQRILSVFNEIMDTGLIP